MSSSTTLTINLIVVKSKKRVVFADCGGDFVDILLSFLTLPMASIIHLAGKDFPIPSIYNLYISVKSLGSHYYGSEACKSMLLLPIDIAATELRSSLPIRFDFDSKGYFCLLNCCSCDSNKRELSLYDGAKCCRGHIMKQESRLAQETTVGQNDSGSGVFVHGGFRYMITDDCVITKSSTDVVLDLLRQHDISDRSSLEETVVHVDASHVLNFLKSCLVSDTSLTDVFLSAKIERTEQHKARQVLLPRTKQANAKSESSSEKDMIKVKLLINKIEEKIIHAEVNEKFVDLLFSFLSYPAGYIINLFKGQMNMMGSFGNIHKSIETLSLAGCFKSVNAKDIVLNPKSPPFFGLKNGLIKVEESDHPKYLLTCPYFEKCLKVRYRKDNFLGINKKENCLNCCSKMFYSADLINPTNGTFLKDSTYYIVNDDLSTKLFSFMSVALNYFKNGEEDGVETIIVEVGKEQALALLKASINSKTALTDALLRNKQ